MTFRSISVLTVLLALNSVPSAHGNLGGSLINTLCSGPSNRVLLVDLDDTLFDTRYRLQRVLAEISKRPDLGERLRYTRVSEIRYDFYETLRNIGLDHETSERLRPEIAKLFFSSEFVRLDRPFTGAARWLSAWHARGFRIVYLTGRSADTLTDASREALAFHGFPPGDLVLKPSQPTQSDLEFKIGWGKTVRNPASIVAILENEPKNLNALAGVLPSAHPVFVNTQHSSAPDRPVAEATWVSRFESLPNSHDCATR